MSENDEPTPEEWAEIEAADAYLDALGNARDFDGDDLGGSELREDIDREPLGPIDQKALKQYYAEQAATACPAPITGGTLSISENAAQVGQLAQDESIAGAIQQAKAKLAEATQFLVGAHQRTTELAGQAANLLGGEDGNTINGQGSQLAEEINRMVEAIGAADQKGDDLLRFAHAFRTALVDMARKHGA